MRVIQACQSVYSRHGVWDPVRALNLLKDQEELAKVEPPKPEPSIVLTSTSSDAEIQAARQRIVERTPPPTPEVLLTPAEHVILLFIEHLRQTAWWILLTHQFPDGQPLEKQHPRMVALWELMIPLMDAIQQGLKPQGAALGRR